VIPGRRVSEIDAPAVQALFDDDPETYAILEGAPPRPDEALQLMRELPPGVTPERRYMYLIDQLALIDLVDGYPDAQTWFLGLIFVARSARGAGLGTQLIETLCSHVRRSGGRALRLGVAVDNLRARTLYDRLGFLHVARRSRTTWAGVTLEIDVLERAV
jgi:ribosomal protein S18 acetylase RimI-like enzyme